MAVTDFRSSVRLLEGVKVLDLSILGPGAVAGFLVDLGADVTKIEGPGGDYARQMTWPIINTKDEGPLSLLHLHLNRGKKFVTIDLKSDEGKEQFAQMVTESDVVIEGMRPGFLDKVGFGFERMKELNPKIVVCSISGYGATGPYARLPSHGVAYDTWAGAVTPFEDADGFSRMPNQPNIGITAGPAFAALAITSALVRARTTGEPACFEIAQSDSAAYFDWYRIETQRAYTRPQSEVTGNASDNYERRPAGLGGMQEGVRYQVYKSADGYVLFMASEQLFWKNFCQGIDRMDLFDKWPGEKYADHARNNTELQAILRDIFATKTTAEWIAFANEHNTTLSQVNTVDTLPDDPQFQARMQWVGQDTLDCEQLAFPLHMLSD